MKTKDIRTYIPELLQSVYRYYPIGFKIEKNNYPGQVILNTIIDKKLEQLRNGEKTQWSMLIDDIQRKTDLNKRLGDDAFYQEPSYQFHINLDETKTNAFNFSRRLFVTVSLLCPIYTMYYSDIYYYNYNTLSTPMSHHICNTSANNTNVKMVNEIISTIPLYFKNFSFIPHNILFNSKIWGYDISGYDDVIKEIPVYNFLFDRSFIFKDIYVME